MSKYDIDQIRQNMYNATPFEPVMQSFTGKRPLVKSVRVVGLADGSEFPGKPAFIEVNLSPLDKFGGIWPSNLYCLTDGEQIAVQCPYWDNISDSAFEAIHYAAEDMGFDAVVGILRRILFSPEDRILINDAIRQYLNGQS